MNRGFLESLPVQQLMMNLNPNPNWWNINNMMKPPPPSPHQEQQPSPHPLLPASLYPPPSSTSSSPLPPPLVISSSWLHENQDHQLPESWSQLLLGGSVGEEDRSSGDGGLSSNYHQAAAVKQEVVHSESSANYLFGLEDQLNHQQAPSAARTTTIWPHHQVMPPAASSPISCVTTTSFSGNSTTTNNNMLDFSNRKSSDSKHHQQPDLSSHECNSKTAAAPATGGSFKKARVQPAAAACSTLSTFKVRKEKLGDRITALHQLVSPFGKTDTASVLLEAIGYIRFLQNQIEALSSPYLGNGSGNMRHQQHSVQGEKNSIFPEDPGQLLNVLQDPAEAEPKKDLRSRGLCLVPVSCTVQVGSDNGADYWAPALGGGFR